MKVIFEVVVPCPDGGTCFSVEKERFEEKYGEYEPYLVALYIARKAALLSWQREAPIKVYERGDGDQWEHRELVATYKFSIQELIRPHWSIESCHPMAKSYTPGHEWCDKERARAVFCETTT